MKRESLKLLYVCHEFPYPPTTGGLVDMWNRIQTLHSLGVTLDVVATPRSEPPQPDRDQVQRLVRRLLICKRLPGLRGLLSLRPGFASIRRALRDLPLEDRYDAVLLQTEFTSEILHNKTLRHKFTIIRVDNDEHSFFMQTARSERSWPRKLYFLFEALRIKLYSSRILAAADMLWFVSHLELERYRQSVDSGNRQCIAFVPTAIDLDLRGRLPLTGSQVLFVGSLWHPTNREAVEWFLQNVHPKLSDMPGYRFVIVGSTLGQSCEWLDRAIEDWPNIEAHYNQEDLLAFYTESAVFVNPMQRGAGVKLKTVEAVLRGLPVVSTRTGAEGSGLTDGLHYKCADSGDEFAARIKEFLADRTMARKFVDRSQEFIAEHYDQRKVLERLLEEASNRCQSSELLPPSKDKAWA